MKFPGSLRWSLLALLLCVIPASSCAQVSVSPRFAPPVLPVYAQPVCPQPGLIWTPGYWAYGEDGYYWVPGAWTAPPYVGALWTPPWWGWEGGHYTFHLGYWAPHVGYYGGVNYGFGYEGIGFAGGEWRRGSFAYNTAVANVNATVVKNTFNSKTAADQGMTANPRHVAYSGGPGGIQHEPTPAERVAEHEQHLAPTKLQMQLLEAAKSNKKAYAMSDGSHPAPVKAEEASAEALPHRTGAADGVTGAKATAATSTVPASNAQEAHVLQGDWVGDFSGEQPFIYRFNSDGSGLLYWTRGSLDDTAGINYSLNGDQITAYLTYDARYTATVIWNQMTGVLSQSGQRVPLDLTNADSSARESGSLRGDWLGELPGNMPIVVNFVHRRAEITNLIGTERFSYSVNGSQITITGSTATYAATIDGIWMNGTWSSDGKSQPMTIVKVRVPAQ
jgi:hypothetical protein